MAIIKRNTEKVKKPIFKRWWFWGIIAVLLIGIIGGGGSSSDDKNNNKEETKEETAIETKEDTNGKPTEFEVKIDAAGEFDGDVVFFNIETNLPDESELMLTLSKGDYNTDDTYTGQGKVIVSNGKVKTDAFSNKGERLSGDYDLVISMSLPSLQSDAVRAVIGEMGEYMTGDLVTKSEIGESNLVRAMYSVSITDDIVITAEDDYSYTIFRNDEEVEEIEEVEEEKNDASVPREYLSALASAEAYSSLLNMSKKGIYDQLTSEYGDKFTAEAAQYAVDNIKADWNRNALKSAENYSNTMHMSKAGIFDQLVSEYGEQFEESEAQYAIDNIEADWNKNALETAKVYQDTMNMSPAAIYDQLISPYGEQFEESEAQYAIDHLDD